MERSARSLTKAQVPLVTGWSKMVTAELGASFNGTAVRGILGPRAARPPRATLLDPQGVYSARLLALRFTSFRSALGAGETPAVPVRNKPETILVYLAYSAIRPNAFMAA